MPESAEIFRLRQQRNRAALAALGLAFGTLALALPPNLKHRRALESANRDLVRAQRQLVDLQHRIVEVQHEVTATQRQIAAATH